MTHWHPSLNHFLPPSHPPSLSPQVAAQTAYGIEAEVEGYEGVYSPDLITFMDFRRHHSGVWEDAAQNLTVSEPCDDAHN